MSLQRAHDRFPVRHNPSLVVVTHRRRIEIIIMDTEDQHSGVEETASLLAKVDNRPEGNVRTG